VVVAEHRSIDDPETGGSYTIKIYSSEKRPSEIGEFRHTRVRLRPDSSNPRFKDLVFDGDAAGEIQIIAELVAIL